MFSGRKSGSGGVEVDGVSSMLGGDGLSSVGDVEADTVGVSSGVSDGLLSALGCVDTSTDAQDESIINARMKGATRIISVVLCFVFGYFGVIFREHKDYLCVLFSIHSLYANFS